MKRTEKPKKENRCRRNFSKVCPYSGVGARRRLNTARATDQSVDYVAEIAALVASKGYNSKKFLQALTA